MLKLTKRTEYGLIAMLHLADREGEVVSVREIGDRYPTMDAMAAAASKMKNETASASTPLKKKSTRVAEAIRAWQRCPKAWRAKLVEGGEPGTSEVEKLKRAEKRKGT